MPRGKPKASGYDFEIRFPDGYRLRWYTDAERKQTDADIARAIRDYLVPIMERIESATSVDAVDPHLQSEGKPSTRDSNSSSSSEDAGARR